MDEVNKMKIISAPDPVLSTPAKEVEKVDQQILKLIDEMEIALDSAKDPEGVGLAAPQVGKSLRLFIAKPSPKDKTKVFINPVIIEQAEPTKKFTRARKVGKKKEPQKLEGCLSLKDIWGVVKRSPTATVQYTNEKGERKTEKFSGFMGTIVQHETDHLNGILFPRRVLEQKGKLYKSYKEKGEDVFEELELP